VVDEILIKLDYYTNKYKTKNIVVGGGVSANRLLRKTLIKYYKQVILPPISCCQDNAAMIGAYAYYSLQ
jgi:N6-L-threonylcarbamoyladenine synthase